jgi:hypothetical protein
MKKLLLAIAAVGTLAASAPAMAQPFHGPGPGDGAQIDQRIGELSGRIDRGSRDGSLNFREARRLRGQLAGIQRLEVRYGRDGINGRERADLNGRLDGLAAQIHDQRHDGDRGGRHW